MLKREGIQFHVCWKPDVKCAVVERVRRTLRNMLFRYFICKNPYRFVDVLQQFVESYNNTAHTAHGMAPAAVTDKNVLAIWTRMDARRSRVPVGKDKFKVGQHVRISKKKLNSHSCRNRITLTKYLES